MTSTITSAANQAPLPPPVKPGRPLLQFFFDAFIGVVVMLGISVAMSLAWGMFKGFALARQAVAEGRTPDSAQITAAIGQPSVGTQIWIVLVGGVASAALLYFWRRRASPAERQISLAAIARPSTWGWAVVVAIAVMLWGQLLTMLGAALGIKPEPTNQSLMQNALQQMPVFLALFAVVLAPAYEELLFRRVLFGRLWQAGRPWLGMLLSGLLFAFMHEVPGTSGNSFAAVCLLWLVYGSMGAAFAWLYRRTGTLAASIFAHGLNNAVALVGLYLAGTAG